MRTNWFKYQGVFTVCGLALIWFGFVSAQQSAHGPTERRLLGRLLDVTCNAGVAKATITIKGNKIRRKVKSTADGKFELYLPPGTYQLTVERYAFMSYIVDDVKVTLDADVTVNLDMRRGFATNDPNLNQALRCPPPKKP